MAQLDHVYQHDYLPVRVRSNSDASPGDPVFQIIDRNNVLLFQVVEGTPIAGMGGATWVYPTGVNDHFTIQAAIDGGAGLVMLAEGTYDIRGTIYMKTGVHLVGSGRNATVLRAMDTLNAPVISTTGADNVFFCSIRDLTIDGNKANNTSGHAVHMRQAHTWKLSDLHIKDAADNGIKMEGASASILTINCTVLDCRVENSNNQGIFIATFAPNNHLRGNIVGGTSNWSCMEISNDEIVVVGNHIHTGAQHGLLLGGKNCNVSDNYVESCAQNGMEIQSEGHGIVGNICFNNAQSSTAAGIKLAASATKCRVNSNRCFDRQGTKTQDYGIWLETGATLSTVVGNVSANADQVGGVNGIKNDAGLTLTANVT